MNQAITALLGAITGFLLPTLASYVRSKMKGSRFENAVKGELDEAKDCVHRKMVWLSRDQTSFMAQIDDQRLLAEVEGKLLYLGEPEEFSVQLPFWEQNLRDIVELTSNNSFNRMCREVSLLRKFVSKFRDMKLTFKVGGGDPKQMARACYRDLLSIHGELIPSKPPAASK
jgi:hypothetical protein